MSWHRMIGSDDDFVSCLVCGGEWRDVGDGIVAEYVAANGDDATDCIPGTHGYPGEKVCHEHGNDYPDDCEHIRATIGCNCFLCDS